jgi:hypothetical protein
MVVERRTMVEIGTVSTEVERELVRSALEAYGIDVAFQTVLPPATYPGLASIKVLVPEEQAELARKVLSGNEGACS